MLIACRFRPFLIVFLWTLLLFFLSGDLGYFNALAESICSPHIRNERILEEISPDKETAFSEEIQVIWYPSWKYFVFSHFEIKIENETWNPFFGFKLAQYSSPNSLPANDKDKKIVKSHLRFHLRVTMTEIHKMKEYLKKYQNKLRLQNGVGGTAKLLGSNTSMKIPLPLSKVAILSVAYLTLRGKLGYERISKVEFYGPRKISRLFSLQPLYEAYSTYNWGRLIAGLLITGTDGADRIIQDLIPLFTSSGIGSKPTLDHANERIISFNKVKVP